MCSDSPLYPVPPVVPDPRKSWQKWFCLIYPLPSLFCGSGGPGFEHLQPCAMFSCVHLELASLRDAHMFSPSSTVHSFNFPVPRSGYCSKNCNHLLPGALPVCRLCCMETAAVAGPTTSTPCSQGLSTVLGIVVEATMKAQKIIMIFLAN